MRLIDADALIEVLQNREIHAESVDKRIAIKGDRQVVINAPTIDACPYYHHEPTGEPFCEKDDRRHGEWKDIDGDGHYWECSACGEVLCCNNNFCPNCGAKMDGERSKE